MTANWREVWRRPFGSHARGDRDYHFMEFCGGHTHAISRYQYWTACKGKGARRAVKGWRESWSNWLAKAAENRR